MRPNEAVTSNPACPGCSCLQPNPVHAMLAALRVDDVDAAIRLGLLDAAPCPACAAACNESLIAARDARRVALAARERHRARNARLARIKDERAIARRPSPATGTQNTPTLPKAASDALAKALAKARERHA